MAQELDPTTPVLSISAPATAEHAETTSIGSPLTGPGQGGARGMEGRRDRVASPGLRYMGYRATGEGREYTLRALMPSESRDFVVFIPHEVFASSGASFQDAPGLCFTKVQRALAAEPALVPGTPLVLSSSELAEHREAVGRRTAAPKRRKPVVTD